MGGRHTFKLCVSDTKRSTEMSSSKLTAIQLPNSLRGLKTFNQDLFNIKTKVPTLEIPSQCITKINSSCLKDKMLKRPGIKGFGELENKPDYKLFVIDPGIVSSVDDFSSDDKEILQECNVDLTSWTVCDLDLNYRNFNYKEILEAILPEDSGGFGGFSQIGHILHLNLREELSDYKQVIGMKIKSILVKNTIISSLCLF